MKIPMALQVYRSRQFPGISNGENPSSGCRDMRSVKFGPATHTKQYGHASSGGRAENS